MLVQDLQHAVRVELIIVAALDLHGLAGQGVGLCRVASEDLHRCNAEAQRKEGLVHCRRDAIAKALLGSAPCIRQQVEGHAVGRPRKGERAHHEHPQNGEQGEHEETPYPLVDDLERFYGHLEQTLLATGFIRENHPGQVMNKLRRLFTRARPESQELNILRGILASIEQQNKGNKAE